MLDYILVVFVFPLCFWNSQMFTWLFYFKKEEHKKEIVFALYADFNIIL